ncbi:MAG: DegT/DnrJ/EryC1/StrS family aminotransferase, partial [Phycisphaeraceae bacterium]
MSTTTSATTLAIDGGAPALPDGVTPRRLFDQREKEAVLDLLDRAIDETSNLLAYGGEQEQAYCEAFCAMLGGGFADGVNSGTNAVHVALAALEPEPGSEVVVPPVTDPGGVMSVALLGCTPVVADSAPGYYNIGAEQIEAVLTERTAAIIVAHIGGIACDMDPILELAQRHDIPVLEDCAQAHLTRYRGRAAGTLGAISAFSTMFGKQHASAGQGGLVYTRDETLYWKARRYADRGKPLGLTGQAQNVVASLNFNMDELHAAVGRVNLAKLPAHIARRQQIAAALAEHCRAELDAVRVVEAAADDEGSYWFLT